MFKWALNQYDKLDQYKKEEMFANGLGKFDDSQYILHSYDLSNYLTCTVSSDVVQKVLDEYKACESPDYISYVSGQASTPSTARLTNPKGIC